MLTISVVELIFDVLEELFDDSFCSVDWACFVEDSGVVYCTGALVTLCMLISSSLNDEQALTAHYITMSEMSSCIRKYSHSG